MPDLLRARNIHGRNTALLAERLNEATQFVLNMLLFCRMLADRDIEPTGCPQYRLEVEDKAVRPAPPIHLRNAGTVFGSQSRTCPNALGRNGLSGEGGGNRTLGLRIRSPQNGLFGMIS